MVKEAEDKYLAIKRAKDRKSACPWAFYHVSNMVLERISFQGMNCHV